MFFLLPNSFSAVLNKFINSLDICETGSDGEYFTVVSQIIYDFTSLSCIIADFRYAVHSGGQWRHHQESYQHEPLHHRVDVDHARP